MSKRYSVGIIRDKDGWALPDAQFDDLDEAKAFAVKRIPVDTTSRPLVCDKLMDKEYQYDGSGVWLED